jgi:hypothetical protein
MVFFLYTDISVAVHGLNFGNTIISKYKAVIYDLKINKKITVPSLLKILLSFKRFRGTLPLFLFILH